MNAALDSLLQHPGIWRGDQVAQSSEDALPTGFAELDELLPGGGWPRGALTEILVERQGIGELRLLLPALARASEQSGWLAWVAPPHVPYAPALAAAGVRLQRLLVAKPQSTADAWWTAEQALRSGACSAVLAWLKTPDERLMRRLQLGAESGRAWGVLFRSAHAAQQRSTAALRLRLEATAKACRCISSNAVAAREQAGAAGSGIKLFAVPVPPRHPCPSCSRSAQEHGADPPTITAASMSMLWVALHFSALSLEIFSRGAAGAEPLAVIEKQGNRSRVKACNAAATARGVRPGMPVAAAQALAADLIVRVRDPQAEQESLAGLAAWAGRFTPAVSFQPPDGLLLEIGSCLRLHRGLDNLLRQMSSGLSEMGYAYSHACAPTAHGAWLLALAGAKVVIREPARLEKILGALPVRLLEQPQETLAGLEMVGAHTLGDCMRLPRAGLARRFGQGLLDEIDRALGRLPEAREFFVPPPSFLRRLELPAQVHEAEALMFAARRLLPELEGYLNLRQAGVQGFELVCCHEDVADTVVKAGLRPAHPRHGAHAAPAAGDLGPDQPAGRGPHHRAECPVHPAAHRDRTRTCSRMAQRQGTATCCWNACASGWGRRRCSASRQLPTIGRNWPGGFANPALAQSHWPIASAPCGCCPSRCPARRIRLELECRTGAHRERLVGRHGCGARLLRGAGAQRFAALGVLRPCERGVVRAWPVRLKH